MGSFPERINTQWSKDSGVSRNMENPKFRQQKPHQVLRDNEMPEGELNHFAFKPLETRYQNRSFPRTERLLCIIIIIIIIIITIIIIMIIVIYLHYFLKSLVSYLFSLVISGIFKKYLISFI